VAGTAYPAMGMHGDADNLVLLPEFVDSSLIIKSVRYVHVEEADELTSSYTLFMLGMATTFSGDQIKWQNLTVADEGRRSHITLENGHWVLRDGRGRIYHSQ
jgi:hypothetical protein